MVNDEKALTKKQFLVVMEEISKKHRFARGGRGIKYVRPDFDMRDGKCFRIAFDNNGQIFDSRDQGTMFENIMCWLKAGE